MAIQDEECASKKPWGAILNGWAKKLVWKSADGLGEEAGRSVGKLLFWGIIVFVIIWLGSTAIDAFTGFFGGWFDWVPNPFSWFGRGDEAEVAKTVDVAIPKPTPGDESACSMWGRNVPAWMTKCK